MTVRNVIAVAVLALSCATACTGQTDGAASQSSEGWPSAKFTTPLEARDKLESLDVFTRCANPTSSDDNSFSSVSCFVADEGDTDWRTGQRQVWVVVARGDTGVDCQDAFSSAMARDYQVVTDNSTFVAIGLMNLADPYLGPDTENPSFKWPGEIWPEDVARALGGSVVSMNDWCPTAFD